MKINVIFIWIELKMRLSLILIFFIIPIHKESHRFQWLQDYSSVCDLTK